MSVLLASSTFTDAPVQPATTSHVIRAAGSYSLEFFSLSIALLQGSVANDSFNLDLGSGVTLICRTLITAAGAGVFTAPNYFFPYTWPNGFPLLAANNLNIGINGIAGAGSQIICQYSFNLYGNVLL